MRIKPLFIIIFSLFFNCKNENTKDVVAKNTTQKSFYKYEKLNDSLSVIKWGTKSYYNKTEPIETFLLDEKTYENWRNEKFICLTRTMGSDTKFDIILPLKKNAKNKYISNSLAYDKINGKVVFEDGNVLTVENLNTDSKETIGNDFKKCESFFIHYCIDSISINNNKVYIEWTTPNKIDKPNKKVINEIKIKI